VLPHPPRGQPFPSCSSAPFFFDLDGTLIDHFAAIHRSYSYTLPQLGLPAPTLAQVRDAVGGGLENAMLNFVRPDQVAAAVQIYRPYWNRTTLDDVVALPAPSTSCATCTPVASPSRSLPTNTPRPPASSPTASVSRRLLAGNFGAQDTPWLKPDPAFTAHVLNTLHADAATTPSHRRFPVRRPEPPAKPVSRSWAVTTGTHTAAELKLPAPPASSPALPRSRPRSTASPRTRTTSSFSACSATTMSRKNASSAAIRNKILGDKNHDDLDREFPVHHRVDEDHHHEHARQQHAQPRTSPPVAPAAPRRHRISSCDSRCARSPLVSAAACRTCPASARVRSTTRAIRLVKVIMRPPTPLSKITGVIDS